MPTNDNPAPGRTDAGLNRRDLLKIIGIGPAATMLPLPESAKEPAPEVQTSTTPAAAYRLKALTPHEFRTIHVLSDWILPADERSGSASQAGVPEFIDDWLAFQGDRLTSEIRGGLTWLDLECNRLYRHDFVGCLSADQKKMLDRMAWPRTAAPGDAHAVEFFSRLRDLVLGGFYSSPMGVKDLPYLGNKMIPVWTGGAPAEVLARLGVTDEEAENQRWLRQRQAAGHWVQRQVYAGSPLASKLE